MKRSTKIILITSACLFFGGILIAGISGAVGGTRQFKELADKQALSFDLPWEDTKLKLTTEGLYFVNGDEDAVENDEETERPFDEPDDVTSSEDGHFSGTETENAADVALSEVKNIEMELGAGEIELKKSTNGTFHVGEGENMKIVSDFSDGVLHIRTENKNAVKVFGFDTGSVSAGKAVIYLPEQAYEEITLDMGAGTCKGDLPECNKLSIRLGAGECEFDYIKAGEVELEVGAGECKIGLLEADELNADIAMGEFEAKALINKELDAKVGMGEISMKIIGEEDDFDYDVEVGAGEVRIGSRSYSGVGSGGSQKNDTGREIDVECGMGEAKIDFVKE
nr:DUF4097 family beta strand repeat protein [Lachnospiraceae bacterium]